MQLLILILIGLIRDVETVATYAPVWKTSEYLKAGSFDVISVKTGN